MMNQWHGWMGGGMWGWTLACILIAALLIVAIAKFAKNKGKSHATSRHDDP